MGAENFIQCGSNLIRQQHVMISGKEVGIKVKIGTLTMFPQIHVDSIKYIMIRNLEKS